MARKVTFARYGLMGAWLSVVVPIVKLLSRMTKAQSYSVAMTLMALASMLTTLAFVVDLYKYTKDATLKKWLIPLIFLLAAVLAAITWLIVVCLKKASDGFRSLWQIRASRDGYMVQRSLMPACA